jgi:tetratricopeptide (TPR) repeat protein
VGLLYPGLGVLLLAASVTAQPAKPSPPAPDLKAIAGMVENGQLGPAEKQLRLILAHGGGPAARDLLGVVLARQGRAEEAEREFKQVLSADAASLDARQHLARLYLDQGREAEAVAELRRAAVNGPLERDLALKLAGVEQSEGHAVLAERQLRSAADRFQSVRALLQLARLQSDQKDAAGALASLRKARAIAPNSEEVLSTFAEVSLAAETPLAAIPILESLTDISPGVARYHYLEGLALMQAGDVVAAVEPLQEAERLEPNRVPTLLALGTALNGRELYAEAKPYLLRGLSLAPDSLEATAALAESEEGLAEIKEAEAHAQRVLSREAAQPTANLVQGMVSMKQERYAEARDALLKAAAAAPTSSKAHYQLSLAYARLNDEAGAQKHLDLYRQKVKEMEDRVRQVRELTGFSTGGMQP